MSLEKPNGEPVDYHGVFPENVFQGSAVYSKDVLRLQGLIEEKKKRLSGKELIAFNQKLEQANSELREAISHGDTDAGKKYKEAIFELCK